MTKKIRFLTEYIVYFFRKYILAVILGIFFGSIIFVQRDKLIGIYRALQSTNTNIGITGLYTVQNLPTSVSNLISFGFTSISENDKAELSPIVDKLDISENNLTYLFTFKTNLYWHNGNKFNTNDIILNIANTKVNTISPSTIEIKLTEAYSPLLSKLSRPIFIKKTLIGLGSYKVENIVYQDGYIKTLEIVNINNRQEKRTYRFYSNNDDLLNAFKLGEIDELSTDSIDNQLSTWPNIRFNQQLATDKYLGIFLNTTKFNNKQIRQAIAYATPKTDDKNSRCLGPISPNSWAYNPEIKEYNINPTRAKELLDKNIIDKIDLIIVDRKLLTVAENIKSNWEQILNTKVNLKINNPQTDIPDDYDAILAYGSIPTDPDQYLFWHSTQTKTNITHLNNSRIDKLLEEGRQIQDQAERKKIYYDFQRFLLEETPVIFLNFPTNYTISRLK